MRAAILLAQEAGGPCFWATARDGTTGRRCAGLGLAPVLAETGAELLNFTEPHEFEVPHHKVVPHLTPAKALLQADVVITLPTLKTHAQMTLTAALKNQYGCIPGALKNQWYFRLQQPEWLASLILDVNRVCGQPWPSRTP